jgi:hypothetical protein
MQLLAEHAADNIGAAACGVWHDQPDRPRRERFRPGSGRRQNHRHGPKKGEEIASLQSNESHRTPLRPRNRPIKGYRIHEAGSGGIGGIYNIGLAKIGPPTYADATKVAQAFVAAAPERMVWGSDWPHPNLAVTQKPDDAVLFDLLSEWAPSDAVRHRILVENPQVLYGFPADS